MKIKQVSAREILDSRGNPTLEATVVLADGAVGTAAVPSGASTGTHEAVELRDGDKTRFGGLGVLKAVMNVNKKIAPAIIGQDALKQADIDELMLDLDGTPNKAKLGANAILAVSLAVCRAAAVSTGLPLYRYLREAYDLPETKWTLPAPTMNIINGGKHADNSLTVQEFMVVPFAPKFSERVRQGAEIFQALKKLLQRAGYQTLVGDEGGFAPNLKTNEEALDFIVKAIKAAGYRPGVDAGLAVDLAMSEYGARGRYALNDKTGKEKISANELIDTLQSWIEKYPLVSLEDPLGEDDWLNWTLATGILGERTIIVGDDLFVTNVDRLMRGVEYGAGNAILIKLNQIGSLSETIHAIYTAKKHGYLVSVSHRSGETADTFIADLAVAVNADFIKTGSLSRSERVEKYNRLTAIEAELKLKK